MVAGFAILFQLRNLVGDDVLVLNGNRGDLKTNPACRRARVIPGGADNVLTRDIALRGLDDPLEGVGAFDSRHLGLPVDLRAHVSGAARHRHGDVGGCNMTVRWVPEGTDEAFRLAQGPQLLDLIHTDQVALHSDRLGRALITAVFVHAITIGRQAKITRDVQADVLAGFFFQGLVELDRILMQLADRVAHVE